MNKAGKASVLAALGLAASLAVVSNNAANAAPLASDTNLFQMTEVSSNGGHEADHSCGAGSCGKTKEGDHKCGAGSCGKAKEGDHKCGADHKCGNDKDGDDHKCGQSSCSKDK
jgi:uncharacterized low-complexity protein